MNKYLEKIADDQESDARLRSAIGATPLGLIGLNLGWITLVERLTLEI